MMVENRELLERFVREGSEPAFRELVTRYLDLVYSTAVRLVEGDTHRAKDISQIVFSDFAKMAGKLSGGTMLGGWFHRHTCYVARTMMRGERRRIAREREAMLMKALNEEGNAALAQIAPILDEAIQELGADDRDAILLRFFERRNLRSVGETLGINENVAQKRVARAVQELGVLLRRRGVALSGAILASALAAGAVKAAPAGLALSITAGVLGTAATGTTALASAKLALSTKLTMGLAGAVMIAGLTAILLHKPEESAPVDQNARAQPATQPEPRPEEPDPFAQTEPVPEKFPERLVRARPSSAPVTAVAKTDGPGLSLPTGTVRSEPTVAEEPLPPIQRVAAKDGSRVRLEGTSNLHDWQVEGRLIGGFLEVGPGFSVVPSQANEAMQVQARAEAFIPIRSLKSVDKDGRPNSDKLDELIYKSLGEQKEPRIRYRLLEMVFKGTTNYNDGIRCQFDTEGELVVAGVTNTVIMPVSVVPAAEGRVIISGATSVRMSAFQIEPRVPPLMKAGDEVRVSFDWQVAAKSIPRTENPTGMVPLVLDLPAAAFKGTPRDLRVGLNVEPLSDKPRPPILVPGGVYNIAPGSLLTCSDKNADVNVLAKITDGDKKASDQSIIFLRKGTQWVQIDFGASQELFAIVIWHAHNAAKVYHDVLVQVADSPDFKKNVRTIFNNDQDNSSGLGFGVNREYFETREGKLINARGARARYVRFYSRGSTESALNEYTELEVYGRPMNP